MEKLPVRGLAFGRSGLVQKVQTDREARDIDFVRSAAEAEGALFGVLIRDK